MKNKIIAAILCVSSFIIAQNASAQMMTEHGSRKSDSYKERKQRIYPQKTFLLANITTGKTPMYGVTVGQCKRFGWYLSAMSNFNFSALGKEVKDNASLDGKIWRSYEYEGLSFSVDILPFYSGKSAYTSISASAGGMVKILPWWAFYAGAGYRYSKLLWETNNGDWIKCDESFSSLLLDGGFLFEIQRFVFSIGVSATIEGNYDPFVGKAGIGFAF
jgi:hypothetical protein